MAFLDHYFNLLQARTGAECFVIVRDDALNDSTGSEESVSPESNSEVKVQASHLQRKSVKRGEPKFQPENIDYNPPCPPKRMNSQDDLAMGRLGFKSGLNQHPELSTRFQSLFGAEIAASRISSRQKTQPEEQGRAEGKGLANLAAPKFPMRKGSRDDLSTLPSSRKRMSDFGDTSNEKINLSFFVDEVMSANADGTKTRQIIRTGSS
jgi:hypothetical protein